MSNKKKLSIDEILGTTQVKCRRMQGGEVKYKGKFRPMLIVKILEGEHAGICSNYGFLTEQAVNSVKESAIYDKNNNVTVTLPKPKTTERYEINWVINGKAPYITSSSIFYNKY